MRVFRVASWIGHAGLRQDVGNRGGRVAPWAIALGSHRFNLICFPLTDVAAAMDNLLEIPLRSLRNWSRHVDALLARRMAFRSVGSPIANLRRRLLPHSVALPYVSGHALSAQRHARPLTLGAHFSFLPYMAYLLLLCVSGQGWRHTI
jgi:hypothetical protein